MSVRPACLFKNWTRINGCLVEIILHSEHNWGEGNYLWFGAAYKILSFAPQQKSSACLKYVVCIAVLSRSATFITIILQQEQFSLPWFPGQRRIKGDVRDTPPLDPNSFTFMQISAKIDQIISWCAPLWGWCPHGKS